MQDLVQTVKLSVILPKVRANYKGINRLSHYWKRPLSCVALSMIVATDNTLHSLMVLTFSDQSY
jgi:hypothetical protein